MLNFQVSLLYAVKRCTGQMLRTSIPYYKGVHLKNPKAEEDGEWCPQSPPDPLQPLPSLTSVLL